MDDVAIFGEVYSEGRRVRSYATPTVRQYKGQPIPWEVHDCTSCESCTYCQRRKREFIAALKSSPPAHPSESQP